MLAYNTYSTVGAQFRLTMLNQQRICRTMLISNSNLSTLSVSLPELNERSYGADCRIYTPEKSNKFSNVYVSTSKSSVSSSLPCGCSRSMDTRSCFLAMLFGSCFGSRCRLLSGW